jgi:NAD(P)-dependent dehydrogenase (short-subunit alcohol dehydrogenase family)
MTVVVTGSASGIGAATSKALRAAGHEVVGVDLRDAEVQADLSTTDGAQRAVDAVLDRCGGVLDSVVLCAGLGPHVPDPQLIIGVNFYGTAALLDGLFPALQKGAEPAAVVVSSVASTHVTWDENPIATGGEEAALAAAGEYGGALAYAWSKNAVTVNVRKRAPEWGAAGVRINTVAPGSIDTPLLQGGLDDPRFGDAIRNFKSPIPRRGTPDEIASLILYLLGPQSGFIHGAQFLIDGGVDALTRPTKF